jgi:hypothetical protein
LLFAFDIGCSRDIFVGQLSQLYFRLGITNIFSVPPALGGLIPQVNGAF